MNIALIEQRLIIRLVHVRFEKLILYAMDLKQIIARFEATFSDKV